MSDMYQDLEATLHDLFWAAEGKSAELPLLQQFLDSYPGSALELGCGSGRLLLPLLEKGYLIEGLDNSEQMLELCKAKKGDSDPVLHHASIEGFQTGALYGAITIPAFTLQLITPDKLPAVLENIHSHLHPGGAVYITTFIPWSEITGELEESKWLLDHEIKMDSDTGKGVNRAQCHTRFQIKRLSQELTRKHRYKILSPQGKRLQSSESIHRLTWYWRREMEGFLKSAGFAIQNTIGDFDPDGGCHEDSQILTVIATSV